MSLLIDALRRAEEAKRAAAKSGETTSADESMTLAPLEAPPSPRRDELQHELDALNERPGKQGNAPRKDPAATAQGQARNLFEVKEADTGRGFLLIVGSATLLALLAIGGYFWWQLQPSGGLDTLSPPRSTNAEPYVAQAVPPRIIPLDTPPQAPISVVERDTPSPPEPTSTEAPRRQSSRLHGATRGSFGVANTPAPQAIQPSEAIRVRIPITRSAGTPAVPTSLQQAWHAYESGDLEKSYGLYRAALAEDARSIDALNGLGAIALRIGDVDRATARFRQVLNLDPENPVALAGLSNANPATVGAGEESRLRNLIAAQPKAAALHFALGNLFAAERRWNEAQQEYFEAYSLQPENPDYRFNLAISLDRLGQYALARGFYLEASDISRGSPAAFDPAAAQARAEALAAELQR